MKILICIKQVPDTESAHVVDETTGEIKIEDLAEFKMNRYDEFVVEEAVQIKESYPETVIDAISVGPERSADVIRRAIGMGADNGIHIETESDDYLSPSVISSWVANYARDLNYTLILAGAISEDMMHGQVGPMIAAHLQMPCASSVIFEQLSIQNGTVYVEREIEGGNRDTIELRLPAVLSLQSGINRPRYPVLSKLLKANKQKLEIIDAASLPYPKYPEDMVDMTLPRQSRAGKILEGTPEEKAGQLLTILLEKALIQ
jgi:electron transfer flavoprotein beta subunit